MNDGIDSRSLLATCEGKVQKLRPQEGLGWIESQLRQ
jgi:hypothetical protein